MLRSLTLALSLAALPAVALAQSATDDSDLFPQDEQYLRFGNDTTNVVISPFIQLDGGYSAVDAVGKEAVDLAAADDVDGVAVG